VQRNGRGEGSAGKADGIGESEGCFHASLVCLSWISALKFLLRCFLYIFVALRECRQLRRMHGEIIIQVGNSCVGYHNVDK
jgi:hypothetical protein